MNPYTNSWQSCLNHLGNLVTTSLVLPSLLAGLRQTLFTELKASGGKSGGYTISSFEYQLDVDGKASPQ